MANIMSIRPPDNLRQILKRCAKQNGFTVNQLVLQILWDWVKQNEQAI